MSSFICKNAPWRCRPCDVPYHKQQGYTHVVVADNAAHSLHRSEEGAVRMVDRLNYIAAHEIMTGCEPNHMNVYDEGGHPAIWMEGSVFMGAARNG